MRHQVKGRKLGRTKPHRKATLQALSCALIKERRIKTTLAKAKELRTFVEPLITTAKVDNTHNRRKVFAALQDKYAVTEIFEEVGPAAVDRPGGYTRVLKLGFRLGDAAEMAVIELVDFNDVQPEKKAAKKKRTRRAGKANKPETTTEETKPKEEASTKEKEKVKKADPVVDDVKEEKTEVKDTPVEKNTSKTSDKEEDEKSTE